VVGFSVNPNPTDITYSSTEQAAGVTSFTISGTAPCSSIVIQIAPQGEIPGVPTWYLENKAANPDASGIGIFPVSMDGTWEQTVTLDNLYDFVLKTAEPFPCGVTYNLNLQCVDASGNPGQTFTGSINLPCQSLQVTQAPCPGVAVVLSPPGVTGCAPAGNPAATLQASITWPSSGGPYPSPIGYNWEVTSPSGDTATKSTPFSGGPLDTTDLSTGWSGSGATSGAVNVTSAGTYTVAVVALFAENSGVPNTCNLLSSTSFDVPVCTPCPNIGTPVATVTGCVGPGSTASVSLATTVTGPTTTSINWTVTNPSGTPFTKSTSGPTTTSGVADGQWLNTATNSSGSLDLSTAGSYAVTVSASGPAIPTSCPPSAPTGFTVPQCASPSGGGPVGGSSGDTLGCAILLVLAIVLLVVGPLVLLLGTCFNIVWVEVVGGALALVGLILFVIWAVLCAAFTSCNTMRTMDCLLFWLVGTVGPVLTALAGIFGSPLCGLVAGATWGGWGAVKSWLEEIMRAAKCDPTSCL
jgi:hypothetical protein